MEFNSIAQLEKFLQSKIKNSLENEVDKEVRNTMKKKIFTKVYAKYTPSVYVRRLDGSRGRGPGLVADSNIKKEIHMEGNHMILSVKNVTKATTSGKYVAEIVETGEGYTWKSSRIYQNPFPRPFTKPTIDELKSTKKHVKALKNGLVRQGIPVT